MAILLTTFDQQELAIYYPELNCSLKRGMIWGTLSFACSLDQNKLEIVFDKSADCFICDNYEIRIDFNQHDIFGFPKVYEESEFIKSFAQKEHINIADLHIYDDNSCCLGIFPEYQWQSSLAYIQDKVIPFFYWQSYRRIYGKEPWMGYSHGENGIKEAMSLPPRLNSKGSSRNVKCPCGSGKKYKKCCIVRDAKLKTYLGGN